MLKLLQLTLGNVMMHVHKVLQLTLEDDPKMRKAVCRGLESNPHCS